MPTVAELNDIASLASEVAEHLRGVRQRLAEEIRDYPTPIPRCDAQFNHLYEQQGRLARDLDRFGARGQEVSSIRQFIASAPYTDDPAEREFRSHVEAALAALGK